MLPIVIILFGVIMLVLVILGTRPFNLQIERSSNPVNSYQEALERIEEITSAESKLVELNSTCGTTLFTHGEMVDNAIVFLHGFTSGSAQFAQLGQEYFKRGYNIYIPRLPRHGIKDRLGNPLKGLTAEELAEFATQSLDITQGLGKRVIVVGLSGGGSMATWLAQERADLDQVVLIAPSLGIGVIPRILNRPLTHLMLQVPDFFLWWDPINKEDNPLSMPYSYTRYPTHALFEILRLGFAAEAKAKRQRPAARSILTITNANDFAVNNAVIAEFEEIWRNYGEEEFQSFQFA